MRASSQPGQQTGQADRDLVRALGCPVYAAPADDADAWTPTVFGLSGTPVRDSTPNGLDLAWRRLGCALFNATIGSAP